jgi:MFS transporter, PAT family, beta-lactamase induction signal transducer AmpG
LSELPKKSFLSLILNRKMLVTLLLGFSSGLPYLLIAGTLKIWLADAKVDITTIGFFSWVGAVFSFKFLWSPLVDRYSFFGIGRRKFWIILSQVATMLGLMFLGTLDPTTSIQLMAAVCVWVAFFSATQDIAIDAFRSEYLDKEELGMGSSMYQYGYRIAMIITGGLAIGLAEYITWTQIYFIMALLFIIGLVTTLYFKEPAYQPPKEAQSLHKSIIEALANFLKRDGAILILFFVFFFKLGDAISGAMLSPYYIAMGFQKVDIGLIAKTFGFASTLVGLFLGGWITFRIGILRSLWIFGILQGLSTASFALLMYTGPVKWALAFTVVFEDVTAGMGSSAFIAYLSSITNRNYTATQFALLSSIAVSGRTLISGFSGLMVKEMGWEGFFYTCALIAVPGLILLYWVQRRHNQAA